MIVRQGQRAEIFAAIESVRLNAGNVVRLELNASNSEQPSETVAFDRTDFVLSKLDLKNIKRVLFENMFLVVFRDSGISASLKIYSFFVKF